MKRVLTVLILVLSLIFYSFNPQQSKSYKVKTVVIDPGHGGHDSGCMGAKVKEKDVALGIAKKLGNYIEKNFSDVKVIYTRTEDKFVELHERAMIANNNKADVFICIHCNSGPKDAYGTETYVMGLHKTDENLNVAKRENASILMEENYKKKYDGFDPNSPEANIIFTLYQNAFLEQSLLLASKIQQDFRVRAGRQSRGVKQAGFLVLYKTTMPSILIETGFLTNTAEERFLSNPQGQDYIASSIFRAFKEYKNEAEGSVIHKSSASKTQTASQKQAASAGMDSDKLLNKLNSEIPYSSDQQPANTQNPLRKEPLSINVDAPKYGGTKTETSNPSETAGTKTPAPSTGDPSKLVLPPDTTPAKSTVFVKPSTKPQKKIDPEVAARAKDREEFEKQRKQKLLNEKIKKEAEERLRKEIEERELADAEKIKLEAEEQAIRMIEAEKQKKEEVKARGEFSDLKAKQDYEAKVKSEMERLRKRAEEELARKQAIERTRLAKQIKAEMLSGDNGESARVEEDDETPEEREDRLRHEEEIKEREARARAIAIELSKKNGNVSKYLNPQEPKKKSSSVQPGVTYSDEGEDEHFVDAIQGIPHIDRAATFFGVQIITSPKPYNSGDEVFKGLRSIAVDKSQSNYKYIYGKVYSFAASVELQKDARERGFSDAFVVAYSKGVRVTIAEARSILNDKSSNSGTLPKDVPEEPVVMKKDPGKTTSKDRFSQEFIDVNHLKGLIYTVQIATSPEPVSLNSEIFQGLTDDIIRDKSNESLIKYMVGTFGTFREANEFRRTLKANGFPESFVVAYRHGERVPIEDARLLTNK